MGLNCTNICALCKFNSLTERQRERKTRSTCFSQDEEIVRLFSEDGHLSLNLVSSGKRIVSERKEKALHCGRVLPSSYVVFYPYIEIFLSPL